MAIQLIKENSKFNIYHQHFLIDNADELTTLESTYEAHFGDRAELPNGIIYIRHSDDYQGDLWEIMQNSGGGGSGSSLPSVTSDDNGDFLAVIDGEWNKKDPPYTVSTESEMIIPLQEVTLISTLTPDQYAAEIQDSNMDRLSVGDTCIVSYQENATERTRSNAQLYTITAKDLDGCLYLGDFDEDNNELDFSRYPFFIIFERSSPKSQKVAESEFGITEIFTNHECTINISADRISKTVIVDDDFKTAVEYSLAHTEVIEKDFLPEQTIFSNEFEDSGLNIWFIEDKIIFDEDIFESLEDGASCYITFNGIEYCCPVYRGDDNIYFGSSDETWEDYPFYFTLRPDGYSYLSIPELQDVTFSAYVSQDELVYSTVLENAIKEIGVSDSNIFLITAIEYESSPSNSVNLSKSEQKSRTVNSSKYYQIDKTFDEISLAYDSGKCCLVKIDYNYNQNYFSQLVMLTKHDDIKNADGTYFEGCLITAENITIRDDIVNELIFTIYSDSSAVLEEKRVFYCLSDPSTGNDGDVLTVVSGEWAPVAPSGGSLEPLVVRQIDVETFGLGKSYNEIIAMLQAGTLPYADCETNHLSVIDGGYYLFTKTEVNGDPITYKVVFGGDYYQASTATDELKLYI